jgi:hypothetical protein
MICADIADRGHPLAPYGLAFSKPWAREVGANPVWYIDVLHTGHRGRDWLTKSLFNIVKQTLRIGGERYDEPFNLMDRAEPRQFGLPLEQSPIADLMPFIEQMGPVGPPGQVRRREFWWEREWRYRGDLQFEWSEVVAVFAPEHRHPEMRLALAQDQTPDEPPALLDPRWGLERMIAALADVPARYTGPIPWY